MARLVKVEASSALMMGTVLSMESVEVWMKEKRSNVLTEMTGEDPILKRPPS